MNIESYNLDKLRNLIRKLIEDNKELKNKLKENNIPYKEIPYFEDEENNNYDINQEDRIYDIEITEELANRFFGMFWGRVDVYAKRSKSGRYYPQCWNRWNDKCPINNSQRATCDNCEHKKWKALTVDTIISHLKGEKEDGSDVVGVYPLFPDGTCRFIVFDFDNHEKDSSKNDFANNDNEYKYEVDALRKICLNNNIFPLVERSRSGKGAHLWIFFNKPISAKLARNFAFLLLDKGMVSVNLRSFNYYDRLYPSQDYSKSIGNLIALPLQGNAVKNGNSVFVDEDFNAYPDQWDVLFNKVKRLSEKEIVDYMIKWQEELARDKGLLTDFYLDERVKPWNRKDRFDKENVVGKLHITLADGIYVDTLNIMPQLQNQIRSLCAIDNPEFYKNKALGYSNYYTLRSIYLGKDIDGYIKIPRGLLDKLVEECNKSHIDYDIKDEREIGKPIRVSFKGNLKEQQDLAVNNMFDFDNGILNAATGFGKTVVASYLISKKKVNTLIILDKVQLVEQWKNELNKFLEINEQLPEYKTKTGRIKTRNSVIGELHSGKDSLSGIIDIAMVGSLYKDSNYHELINKYGMIIIDECHHSASNMFVEVLKKINAKYVYGFSATLKRSDKLDKIVYMMIGPIRHQYSALQRSYDNKMNHYIIPRFTRVVDTLQDKNDINRAYNLVCFNGDRNNQILFDVKECINNKQSPLVLTKYKEHAKQLYDNLLDYADNVFIIYGGNTNKENYEIIQKINNIKNDESIIIVATAQKIGEGFNCPRLDTLILASPVSHESPLTQFVGRIDRIYENKESVYVYDYVDSNIRVFDNMYKKRLKTYKKIGFKVFSGKIKEKQNVNSIYDSTNYIETFEQDLIEANKNIVISSPLISKDRVERIIELLQQNIENGIEITIITEEKDVDYQLIDSMKRNNISIILKDEIYGCFAIIDNSLIWYGGANLLGKDDVWDNLIRLNDEEVATELLHLAFNK